jgi:histidinol-phosphate aminotransferase
MTQQQDPGDVLRPQPGIYNIDPYAPGRSSAAGEGRLIKLSSNETPLGASQRAIEAFQSSAASLDRYPDGTASALREAIAEVYKLPAAQIVCSTGSDEMINLLAHSYLGPGDEAIYPQYGFLIHKIAMLAAGAKLVVAPEFNYCASVDAILKAVTPMTRAVFLANPNNPTGTCLPRAEIWRLREGLPQRVLLVLDAAYAEYVTMDDYEAGAELVSATDNTVMVRTFSKIYGLAAARLGWAYCPAEVAGVLNRVRGPFNVTGPTMAAGIGALADRAHVDRARVHNDEWRAWLTRELRAIGLGVTESAGNFVLIHFPAQASKTAADADHFLMARRMILRQVSAYGLPDALRMTVGLESENREVVRALTEFLA